MKFSKKWLDEWLGKKISVEVLRQQLPMLGHEIDSIEPVAKEFTQVIVAQIIECKAHPNADRLKLCVVTDGITNYNVVCGASNAKDGLKVALAKIGAVLPGNWKIKRGKIRGEISEGMLCSASELGLAEVSSGIIELPESAPLGKNLRDYFDLDDVMFQVDLTPNRGDCLSIQGIAREIAAKNAIDITPITIASSIPTSDLRLPVCVEATKACPWYAGRVINDIDNQKTTPIWLQERLRRSGIRTINLIVDIANYVMLELGQPLHAFDIMKINKEIRVRYAQEGEKIKLLTEEIAQLKNNTLVIADNANVLAIAGVMGGYHSGCFNQTQGIFLESALFLPTAVAGIARQYGLHSDASHRFERGVDPTLPLKAIERATALILEYAGGQVGPVVSCLNQTNLPTKKPIPFSLDKAKCILGMDLTMEEVSAYLEQLDMQIQFSNNEKNLTVIPPTFRYDIECTEDLIEEIARIKGYESIPVRFNIEATDHMPQMHETQLNSSHWQTCLIERGYHEAITYSFTDPKLEHLLNPKQKTLNLTNPISSELAVMRTTLWPGLLQTLQHNQNRQQVNVRLFEIGKRFLSTDSVLQEDSIAGLVAGNTFPEQWGTPSCPVDFYDVKADVEALFKLTGLVEQFEFIAGIHPALHPGQSAKLHYNKKEVGWIGALHPKIKQTLDLSGSIFLFELKQSCLTTSVLPRFTPLSKFPSIRRDLALVVNKKITVQELIEEIKAIAGNNLISVNVFDLYQGVELPEGHQSIAIALVWQNQERTLTDNEINVSIQSLLTRLKQKWAINLRV